jgi:hypothetical protein
MPMCTRHTVTGELSWDDRNHIYRLDVGGGAFWFVDISGRPRNLIGQRVTLEGTRSGFNLLDVHRVIAINGTPARREKMLWLGKLIQSARQLAIRK